MILLKIYVIHMTLIGIQVEEEYHHQLFSSEELLFYLHQCLSSATIWTDLWMKVVKCTILIGTKLEGLLIPSSVSQWGVITTSVWVLLKRSTLSKKNRCELITSCTILFIRTPSAVFQLRLGTSSSALVLLKEYSNIFEDMHVTHMTLIGI